MSARLLPLCAEDKLPQEQIVDHATPGAIYFTPPAGWHLADKSALPAHVHLAVVGQGKGSVAPSIRLATEKYPGTLKDYLQKVKALNAAKGHAWKDLGKIQTEAGEGSLSQVDRNMEGQDVRMMHTIVLKNGTIYILTAMAAKEEFPSFYKPFFTAMSSFHINDEAPEHVASKQ
ncbi:MAG: hypothetical protein ACXWM7_01160 [Parachlamydiaceae bacterium]